MSTAISFRMGYSRHHESVWCSDYYYTNLVTQDQVIRDYLKYRLGLLYNKAIITRDFRETHILLLVNPQFNNKNVKKIEHIQDELSYILSDHSLKLELICVGKLAFDNKGNLRKALVKGGFVMSSLISNYVVNLLEQRCADKIIQKEVLMLATCTPVVLGYNLVCAGPFPESDRAQKKKHIQGVVPFSTLDAKIEYTESTAFTVYGSFGVKSWVNYTE